MTLRPSSPAPRFNVEGTAPAAAPSEQPRSSRLASALSSGLLLALSCFIAAQLRLEGDSLAIAMFVGLVIGIVLGALRWIWVAWLVAAVVVAMIGVIAFSPMVPNLIGGPEPADALTSADAAVALGAGVHEDGTPDVASEDRVLHAIAMVRLGYTRRIILCGTLWTPTLLDMVRDLGNDCEVISTGPVANTHDEALAVARIMREHHWERVILVTEAWHMPRAAAVFRSAGANVLRAPCSESRYDLHHPAFLADRLTALKDWLHEAVGIRVYRWRGWITPDAEHQQADAPATEPAPASAPAA